MARFRTDNGNAEIEGGVMDSSGVYGTEPVLVLWT